MKKLFLLVAVFFTCNILLAQKINVQETNKTIDDINRTGLAVIIDADNKDVDKAWKKRLKDFGKVSSSRNTYTVEGAEIPGVTSNPGMVYSLVDKEKGGTVVFWAIDLGTEFVTSNGRTSGAYSSARQILYDFAASVYRDKISEEIEDAEKALGKTTKDYEKVVKEGEDLADDLEDNKEEKLDLEQKLKENAQEKVQLEKDIEQNKKNQQQAKQEVEKMKQAVEVVKKKLDRIGK